MAKNTARLAQQAKAQAQTDKVVQALPRGSAKQAGSSILLGTIANINGFLANPDAIRLQEYERALTTDETVAGAIDFIQLSLIASMGEYQHPREDIRRFVQENLDNMEGNFRQALGEMVLSALWSGFACSEMVWRVDGGSLWLERMANYHPGSIHMAVDRNGYLTEGGEPMMPGSKTPGVYQMSPVKGWGTYLPLPMNKLCILTHRKRHNNYYGESIIRRIYKLWKYKDPGLEMWAIALDRYGTPVVYAVVPNLPTGREIGDSYSEGGKRAETMADSASVALAGIHTGTGLVLENPDPQNEIQLGTLSTGNNYGTSFENFIGHLDRGMYRGMLIPQLVFSDGKGGMNSTAQTHFAVYQAMIKALYSQFVEQFTEQVIGRLIRYNFNETNPGKFPWIPFDPTISSTITNALDKMVDKGVVDTSDITDLNIVRQIIGLPSKEQAMVKDIHQLVEDKSEATRSKVNIAQIRADAQVKVAGMRTETKEVPKENAAPEDIHGQHALDLDTIDVEHQNDMEKMLKQHELDIEKLKITQQHQKETAKINAKAKASMPKPAVPKKPAGGK